MHAFPDANIPVVQLSINALKPAEWHLAMGIKLAALRERGVLVVGSGNVVHNLRLIDWNQPDGAFDWARRFDEDARRLMTERPGDMASIVDHPDYRVAVPTPEHFLPMLYLAGMATAANETADVLIDGYSYGSLSMTAYTLGCSKPTEHAGGLGGAAPIDSDAPPESSNV